MKYGVPEIMERRRVTVEWSMDDQKSWKEGESQ